jgi:TolB protein
MHGMTLRALYHGAKLFGCRAVLRGSSDGSPLRAIHLSNRLRSHGLASHVAGLRCVALTALVLVPSACSSRTPHPASPRYTSRVTIYDVARRSATVVYEADGVWEAPNWSRDGRFLLANSGGRLYRIPVDGGSAPELVALDPALRCNNDHDFSPDGTLIAISASSPASQQSQIHVARADGANPRLVVSAAPSYFHGWSPDGRHLAFVANRDGRQYDLYRVPAAGGPEERLTADPAYDDGPDYSRDGRWIYFNSNRGGGWNIWRIPADGAGPDDRKAQRITNDELEDWFPHPSPDGRSLLLLSFPHGTEGHNDRTLRVQLRLIPMPTDSLHDVQPQVVVALTGGQGTINVNSWSPDSRRFAYVSYELESAR